MPVRVTPQQATQKWVSRLGQATQEITTGVNRVTVSPGQLAAAKYQKWLQAVNDSAAKWRRNTGAVSLESWKHHMTTVGIPRIAQGAQAKQDKTLKFFESFLPYLDRGTKTVHAMPDLTFEDRINRMIAMARHNHDYKGSGTGGTAGH